MEEEFNEKPDLSISPKKYYTKQSPIKQITEQDSLCGLEED